MSAFGSGTTAAAIKWGVVGVLLILAGGYAGILMGPDANWDLKNYHLYNVHALLNGRMGFDIAPAQRQSYHNPALDLPFYGLLGVLNDRPRVIAFLMSVPYGVAATMILWLATRLIGPLRPAGRDRGIRWSVPVGWGAATAIGVGGAATIGVIGSTMGEIQASLPVLLALCLLVWRVMGGPRSFLAMGLVGVCVGVAASIKLPYAVYGLAIGMAMLPLVVWGKISVKELLVSGLGVLVGLCLVAGPWMAYLYVLFGNPMYPYFNDIFASPLAEPLRFNDPRFLPHGVLDAMSYPFRWAFTDEAVAAERPFRDVRFAAVIVLAGLAVPVTVFAWGRRTKRQVDAAQDRAEGLLRPGAGPAVLMLGVFAAVAATGWMALFGIYRYAVPLEMLSGIFIVLLVISLLRVLGRHRATLPILVLVTVVVLGTTAPLTWGRSGYGEQYLAVDMPPLPENAVVVLVGHDATAFMAAYVPSTVRVIGLENNFLRSGQDNESIRRIREILTDPGGPLFAIAPTYEPIPHSQLLEDIGLAPAMEQCTRIRNSIADFMQICPLVRTSANAEGSDDGNGTPPPSPAHTEALK